MTNDWYSNVGTQGFPVTRLHERAVALIYDELQAGLLKKSEVRVRLAPEGEISGNLIDGAARVGIPDDITHIGGIEPDLALYNEQHRPVRIIEVVVTNPPDKNKLEKMKILRKRGIDIVVVKVPTPDSLLNLCWIPVIPRFLPDLHVESLRHRTGSDRLNSQMQGRHDAAVAGMIRDLANCSPEMRRKFLDLMASLNSLDSLFPMSGNNPKQSVLFRRKTSGS